MDNIMILQEVFYNYRYKKGTQRKIKEKTALYFGFMDLAKAFDTVPRNKLYKKIWKLGIKGKIYRVIKDLFSSNKARIRIGEYESESIKINSGVIQGSKLGPILFNIYINDLLEELNSSNLGVAMPRTKIAALGYADDVALLADEPSKLQALINICERWSRRNGMSFNTIKCKILALNVGLKGLEFSIYGKRIEMVT